MKVKPKNSNSSEKKDLTNKITSDFWNFNFINYILFIIGLLFIIFGYYLMYNGEVNSNQTIVTAPRLLIVGYCMFIPAALVYKPSKIRGW